MKVSRLKFLTVLIIGLVSVNYGNAQSKSELSEELKVQNEKIAKMEPRLASLEVMYSATKERLGGEDFNPENFKALLDSAAEFGFQEDSVYKRLKVRNTNLTDSVNILSINGNIMSANLDTLKETVLQQEQVISNCLIMLNLVSDEKITREDVEKGLSDDREQVIHELKQLKELLDSGILTQEEFDAKKKIVMEKW